MINSMSIADELFVGGPPMRLQRTFGLVKPGEQRVKRRALLVVLIGWVPLAVLAILQALTMPGQTTNSFFTDFAVHARYLIAAPALILAEGDCIPRLGTIVRHFLDAGLVVGPETKRYEAALGSTRRLLDSSAGEVIVLVLTVVVIAALVLGVSPIALPEWRLSGKSGLARFSAAGYWHMFVSFPLLLVLFFGWLWRLALWARFLFLMSLLDLHLIPGHPDHVGGLKFVSSSLRSFRLIAFAMGAVVAGGVANFVVRQGTPPPGYKSLVITLLVFILILFAGPLTVFLKKLRSTKKRGILEYGALAGYVGAQFEAKWLKRTDPIDQTALEATDFSATTDLYGVTANVYEMRDVPFSLKDLIRLAAAGLAPFIPVALLAMPVKVILESLAKVLL